MIFFDFWNKLDLNIFNKKNFEKMIFFNFNFSSFSQFLKKLDKKKNTCFNFLKIKKKLSFEKKRNFFRFLEQIRFEHF